MKPLDPDHCDNCGSSLHGEYCHNCGQRNIDFRKDWRGLTAEVFGNIFNLHGKLLPGLADIAFRPWKLAREYLQGKRVSNLPPLKTYLFISMVFFLILSNNMSQGFNDAIHNDNGPQPLITIEDEASDPQIENPLEDAPQQATQSIKLNLDEHSKEIAQMLRSLGSDLHKWIPRLFLIGVVLLAGILRLLFIRHRFVYLEHLNAAIILQSFPFLWITILDGWSQIGDLVSPTMTSFAGNIAILWLFICPVIAIKRIYEIPWWKTLIKSGIIAVTYAFFLLLGVALITLTSFYMHGLLDLIRQGFQG